MIHFFLNIIPFRKSIYLEYPSVVTGNTFIDWEKDGDTGDITLWMGRLHAVISPEYG